MTETVMKMKPRIAFDSYKHLQDIRQAKAKEQASSSLRLIHLGEGRRIPLSQAVEIVHKHLMDRQQKDQELYRDILAAGLGEISAKDRMKAVIDTLIMEYRIEMDPDTLIEGMNATESIFAQTCGASLIEDLKDLPGVEEIQVIDKDIFLIMKGETIPYTKRKFNSTEEVLILQDRLALCGKKPINENAPWVQSYLWNGSRLVMSRAPYSDVPAIHIRNFIVRDVTLEMLSSVEYRTINSKMVKLLKLFVRYHACMLIGGSTNTGKTTFLFGLCQEIPEQERIRTLESDFEIALRRRLKGIRSILGVRKVDDIGLTMEEAFKPLLVMSPHWVVLGEGRGAEINQAIQGALRGHDVMATMHTKYRESFVSDVIDMMKQDGRIHDTEDAKKRIARAFNIIIFLRLVKIDGQNYRIATEITELSVDDEEKVQVRPLIEWDYLNREWKLTGHKISRPLMDHMIANGANPSEFKELGFWE
ncbi:MULTISPECIES: ATPase, T2SS/T4P/T4SS family [unclassified Paenibacillus]|uniref:ATPase, T2SS/T4P/T4SS family n=1 Tax=unclassified Paenibacillus TaxID=185978 RepID=UPI00278A68DE|nr:MULTISPECIES: ATPase, T2SS/T4P/T4SS family [unclassified Paenibacillus]MDQ0896213.1 pilus assembly protein CpaF [Paenibacillus sp. V4I7]MDQ0913971.1 pilus assembly protein CpaF [Paenibacillus sp. V4I5]